MLRVALADDGVTLSHQKSLNMAARMAGFKNWAHAQSADYEKSEAVTVLVPQPSKEAELTEALEWVSRNYVSTLAGKPVRDADECLSYASKLLGQQVTYDQPEPEAPFTPQEVDWATALESEDLTHLKVNGNIRELCHVHRRAFDDATKLNELVFAYTIAEAGGQVKEVRVRDLLQAVEVEPGFIQLKDGRTLQLLVEEQTWWLAYSPSAGELL